MRSDELRGTVRRAALERAISHAAHLLPAQNPLDRFVHHNPLHAFEHLPFADAVVEASSILGTEPFLAEDAYLDAWRRGRILVRDLERVIGREVQDGPVAGIVDRRTLARVVLTHPVQPLSGEALAWVLTETEVLSRPRADLSAEARARLLAGLVDDPPRALRALWKACEGRRAGLRAPRRAPRVGARLRDQLVARGLQDPDTLVHPLLIRWCAAWLDQGVARWPLADRDLGFYRCFLDHLDQPLDAGRPWLRELRPVLRRARLEAWRPLDLAMDALERLGHDEQDWDEVCLQSLLALRGWAGMFQRLHDRPDTAPELRLPADVTDVLAVRLALDAAAASWIRGGRDGAGGEEPLDDPVWHLFHLAQALGLSAFDVDALSDARLARLLEEALAFDDVRRRRLWHEAYEHRFRVEVLDAVGVHALRAAQVGSQPVRVQCVLCLDDRSESLRRHLEEVAPWIATLGVAGNYGLAMHYRGLDHARALVLGPIGVVPTHHVMERPGGLEHDFTLEESVEIVAGTLAAMGLVRDFAPLVLCIGHGSRSRNNPHRAAYDCGACGGGSGGPNARLFAHIANDPQVRAALAERGIAVPDSTWFVAGAHGTSDDSIRLDDLDRVPEALRSLLEETSQVLEVARRRNAHERCRRFESAPLSLDVEAALRHVQHRAKDLAQARPEYGHATNAICLVGRRTYSRGLFLDRRAFLASYDPTTDADGAILGSLLAVVLPVCSGINLEYWFSAVDPARYGAGTKLPHNISGLLGVMDGHQSDLRTGLPWQMVELHQPVRLLCVVEAATTVLTRIVEHDEALRRLVVHGWIALASLDPETRALQLYEDGALRPWQAERRDLPRVSSSAAWYAGSRAPLPPASVLP